MDIRFRFSIKYRCFLNESISQPLISITRKSWKKTTFIFSLISLDFVHAVWFHVHEHAFSSFSRNRRKLLSNFTYVTNSKFVLKALHLMFCFKFCRAKLSFHKIYLWRMLHRLGWNPWQDKCPPGREVILIYLSDFITANKINCCFSLLFLMASVNILYFLTFYTPVNRK